MRSKAKTRYIALANDIRNREAQSVVVLYAYIFIEKPHFRKDHGGIRIYGYNYNSILYLCSLLTENGPLCRLELDLRMSVIV